MNTAPLFIKTSKQFNHIGIVLMWLCVGLMALAFFAETTLMKAVTFGGFTLLYLFFMAALRRGAIFDFVVVQPNHFPRLLINSTAVLLVFAGLAHLATYGNPAVFVVVAAVSALAATLLRFVGVQD